MQEPHVFGKSIVIRTVTKGKIRWASVAFTVVDTLSTIAYFRPERSYAKVTKGTHSGGSRQEREAALREELLTNAWELIDIEAANPPTLVLARQDRWFSVWLRPESNGGDFVPFYVNIERPHQRTPMGFDIDDLCLDLRITSSNAWEVKDVIEYHDRVKAGLYSREEQDAIRRAQDEALSLIHDGLAPFDRSWSKWRPELHWQRRPLPPDWDNLT